VAEAQAGKASATPAPVAADQQISQRELLSRHRWEAENMLERHRVEQRKLAAAHRAELHALAQRHSVELAELWRKARPKGERNGS
jgi:hypothetical protein